ncbi:peptidase T [Flavitalea sp.]|nr:peptidase T [Flavitalea sp.]
MFENYEYTVAERFTRYAAIDTQSDPNSTSQPSTEKQKDLSRLLVQELKVMGIMDAELDEYGYVYATIKSNSEKQVPVVCFCAHVDTAPDSSGTNVKPLIHYDYDGSDIVLPDDPAQIITTAEHPYLLQKKGDDIITASGTTLLGADDKAGVAVIMDMANYLAQNPLFKHGDIRILFTPDEEIGRGVNKVDIQKLGAEVGYTLDGGELGSYEDETFSANGMKLVFHGISAHPGYAKGSMVNAMKVAANFLDSLPKDEFSPETTDGRYGFVHPVAMEGSVEKATVQLILRDFYTHKVDAYIDYIKQKAGDALELFPGAQVEYFPEEQYRNMKEIIDQHPRISAFAHEAIARAGVKVIEHSARGGTDGSRLSFMGLPCPNIFTGEMAFHGKHEYVSIQDMQKSVQTIVHLAGIWEEKS